MKEKDIFRQYLKQLCWKHSRYFSGVNGQLYLYLNEYYVGRQYTQYFWRKDSQNHPINTLFD